MTINAVLFDDDLLHIFDYYVAGAQQKWCTLVSVCQRWRKIVYGSPHRLNLRIFCTSRTPVRTKLDDWPALPIVISVDLYDPYYNHDNIKAALERNERVSEINLPTWGIGFNVLAALEKPFPVLTGLTLRFTGYPNSIFPDPDKFLGGSNRLRSLSLSLMPITELPKLLLSFTDLVDLRLDHVPIMGQFSPKAIIASLSALTRLGTFHFNLKSDQFRHWEHQPLPPPTRAVLPSLTMLEFEGRKEYFEGFIAGIDAPLLDHLSMTLHCFDFQVTGNLILIGTEQTVQFISLVPKFQALDEVHIGIDNVKSTVSIEFLSDGGPGGSVTALKVVIPCDEPEREFPYLARFCRSPFFPLLGLKDLYIEIIDNGEFKGFSRERWLYDAERTRLLQLLRPFTSVKNLHLPKNLARRIAPVLKELGGEIATAVPTLHQENRIFLKLAAFLSIILDYLITLCVALASCFLRCLEGLVDSIERRF